jgi:hypothetical protein
MREELDRRDIGIAVDDAAGHQRARIGLLLGDLGEPRHKVTQQENVGREPDDEGRCEAPVAGGREHNSSAEVEDDIHQHVENLHDDFAHRQCGLHQLGGDAAGEFVLEIAHRLPDEVAVAHPADALGVIA